jgi:diguanylate cyclase (GGDEF)-like protein
VASGGYVFVYISEYSFLVIILCNSYVLLNEFVHLHIRVEDYSINLEKIVEGRTKEIRKLNESLKLQTELDSLTGIYNRGFFNNYFEIEVKRAQNEIQHKQKRKDLPCEMNFGLAIFDIDNFKKINDTYGHLVGDKVIIEIVNSIKKNIFARDIFCRFGGEEFVLLFTRTSKEGIIQAVKKIHKGVQDHRFEDDSVIADLNVTISIGVVTFDEASDFNNMEILQIADDRLLWAKENGKNRISFGSET